MKLGRVVGSVTATAKHPSLVSHKLLMVRSLKPDGTASGKSIIALDMVQAGIGDTVLLLDEGNSARTILGDRSAPVRSVIAGIVDSVDRV